MHTPPLWGVGLGRGNKACNQSVEQNSPAKASNQSVQPKRGNQSEDKASNQSVEQNSSQKNVQKTKPKNQPNK